jgi:hypothetical protein
LYTIKNNIGDNFQGWAGVWATGRLFLTKGSLAISKSKNKDLTPLKLALIVTQNSGAPIYEN